MNYFELFNIEPTYKLNEGDLQFAYLRLQKKYHPDNCQSIEDQLDAVEMTIKINDAYQVLSNDVSLLVYYFKQQGVELLDKEIQKNLTPDHLMFLLDLQENIKVDFKNKDVYKQELNDKVSTIKSKIIDSLDGKDNTDNKEKLAKLIFFNKALKHID